MYRPAPRHPLRSFQFWFLVIGCLGATTAWQLGWLPHGHDHHREAAEVADGVAHEVKLGPDAEQPPAQLARKQELLDELQGRTAPPTATPATAPVAQQEPAPAQEPAQVTVAAAQKLTASPSAAPDLPAPPKTPEWQSAQTTPQSPPAANNAPTAPATTKEPDSPFGRANLEFVSATARQPAEAAEPAERFTASPGMIQQVSAEQAVPDVAPPATVVGGPPAIFPQETAPQVDFNAIDRLLAAGQDVEAHRILSSLYWEHPDLRARLNERINQAAMRIYFQPQPHYIDPYTVQPGDRLESIAKSFNISWEYLAKLNRIDPLKIRPGQKLKVIQGPFGAVVDLRRFELTVHAHGYYVARFPIGIGKDNATPVGEFTIQDKLENPTYYGPDGVIAADDPRNPLGEFWLSLGDSYGLHGTIDEATIGRAESRGCIRLRRQDIADLYDLLTVGSTVVIRR